MPPQQLSALRHKKQCDVSQWVHVQAGLAQVGLRREKRERLQILDGVSGVLQPGRMTLLLGPPSSGKSTLLKALAGLLTPDRNLKVQLHHDTDSRTHLVL